MSLHRTDVTPIPKPPKATKTAKKLAKNARPSVNCDVLFSKIVRARDRCEVGVVSKCPSGSLQCAHLFSRRYRSVRWSEVNAVSACAGCHLWMTHHPIEWQDWCVEHLGRDGYDELRHLALHGPKVDVKATQAALEQRWAEICGRAEEFVKVCPDVDEGLMIGWFANAIETARSHEQARIATLEAELEAWRNREPLSPDPERVQFRWLVVRNRALEAVVSAARAHQGHCTAAQALNAALAALDATQPEPVTPTNTSVTSNNTSSTQPEPEDALTRLSRHGVGERPEP